MRRTSLVSLLFAILACAVVFRPATAAAQWYPYPYPYPYYYPVYFRPEADVRVLATPKQAEVYVDGYYAGIVDDFNGVFQRLHVPPGDHAITLHLEGYRTVTQKVYLAPDTTFKLRYTLETLAPGEVTEPPPQPVPSPSVPPQGMPPAGRVRPAAPSPPSTAPAETSNFGALVIHVQPSGAEVLIDGERWNGPQGDERLVVQLSDGSHHIEVRKVGYRAYSSDVRIRRGETTPLNVRLPPARP